MEFLWILLEPHLSCFVSHRVDCEGSEEQEFLEEEEEAQDLSKVSYTLDHIAPITSSYLCSVSKIYACLLLQSYFNAYLSVHRYA